MDAELQELLDKVTPRKRKRDAETMLELMARVTGQPPVVSRSAVGYGTYHYRYASGREGDAPAAGFAPRKTALVVYILTGVDAYPSLLEKLGPHTASVGCIYIKDLELIDLAVLEEIITQSYQALTAGTYTLRASEGGSRA